MATLGMQGPYSLTEAEVDKWIRKDSIGNYALGETNEKGTFIVKYVGRSDTDLNSRLKDHVGSYKQFKFSYAASPMEAYKKELQNYNDFGGSQALDNEIEPGKP